MSIVPCWIILGWYQQNNQSFLSNYSGVNYFTKILSLFLQYIGKNGAKIKLVLHFYHGFTSVVTNILPLWGYSFIVTFFILLPLSLNYEYTPKTLKI